MSVDRGAGCVSMPVRPVGVPASRYRAGFTAARRVRLRRIVSMAGLGLRGGVGSFRGEVLVVTFLGRRESRYAGLGEVEIWANQRAGNISRFRYVQIIALD